MIKNLLLWFLKDEIVRIAEHEAGKVVGVISKIKIVKDNFGPATTAELSQISYIHPKFEVVVDKVYLQKGDQRIFINDFTVQGDEGNSPTPAVSEEELASAKPLVSVDLDESSDSAEEKKLPFYYHDVLRLLNEGLSERQVYNKVYMAITDIQYQDALGWAKEQRKPVAEAPAVEDDSKIIGSARKRTPKYDLKAIQDALRSGQKPSVVSKAYGVSEPTVYKIRKAMEGGANS